MIVLDVPMIVFDVLPSLCLISHHDCGNARGRRDVDTACRFGVWLAVNSKKVMMLTASGARAW